MDLGVRLVFDHAGLVGDDGETHQGIYDVAFLNSIPTMSVVMGKDYLDVQRIMKFSLNYNHPLAIRFPKANCIFDKKEIVPSLEFGQWDKLKESSSKDILIISYGPHLNELEKSLDNVTLINAIFISPINVEVLKQSLDYKNIIIYDAYATKEGFIEPVKLKLYELGYQGNIVTIGLPNVFVKKGSVIQQERRYHVDVESVINKVKELSNGSN
jgi:1-deoxy-D-xylulose-5-phosphate synthase